jgi:hypothetical protein
MTLTDGGGQQEVRGEATGGGWGWPTVGRPVISENKKKYWYLIHISLVTFKLPLGILLFLS